MKKKDFLMYVRYPYVALIIAVMWISMALIIAKQKENVEIYVVCTSLCTLYLACRGFKSPK